MARKHTPAPVPTDPVIYRLAVSFDGGWEVLIMTEDDANPEERVRLILARDPDSPSRRENVHRVSRPNIRTALATLAGTEWEVFYQPLKRALGVE